MGKIEELKKKIKFGTGVHFSKEAINQLLNEVIDEAVQITKSEALDQGELRITKEVLLETIQSKIDYAPGKIIPLPDKIKQGELKKDRRLKVKVSYDDRFVILDANSYGDYTINVEEENNLYRDCKLTSQNIEHLVGGKDKQGELVALDENEVHRIIAEHANITSKYKSKQHLIAGDDVMITHEQFCDLAKAICAKFGTPKPVECEIDKESIVRIAMSQRCNHAENICNNCYSDSLLRFDCEKLADKIMFLVKSNSQR